MPIYDYRCLDCGSLSEFLVGVGSGNRSPLCPQCGSHRLEKALSLVNPIKARERSPRRHFPGAGGGLSPDAHEIKERMRSPRPILPGRRILC